MKQYRPFRLINSSELKQLELLLKQRVDEWSNQYSILPLEFKISLPIKSEINSYISLVMNNNLVGCIDPIYHSILQKTIFNISCCCFTSATEKLCSNFLAFLFGGEIIINDSKVKEKDYFYLGAPTLLLTFTADAKRFSIYLNPSWVQNLLPISKQLKLPVDFKQAVDNRAVELQIRLNHFTFNIKEILKLKKGDVIRTDHPLTSDLILSHENQKICSVSIGKINEYKTIQIEST